MLHPVKVFDAKGKLKRIVSTKELLRLSDAAFNKKKSYSRPGKGFKKPPVIKT